MLIFPWWRCFLFYRGPLLLAGFSADCGCLLCSGNRSVSLQVCIGNLKQVAGSFALPEVLCSEAGLGREYLNVY